MEYSKKQLNTAPNEAAAPTAVVGIIGGGFGGLLAYTILRFRGAKREEILVFSPDTSPEHSWMGWVRSIGQKTMRSESAQHFFPTDSPGLATIEALRNWSIKPLLQSWFDAYHPSVDFVVDHAIQVARQVGFFRSLVPTRIERVVRDTNESFVLYGPSGVVGRVRHIIMAVGHGPRHVPAVVQTFWEQYQNESSVGHAFDGKDYRANETVLVLGDGLTAAHEWMSILERGGKVIAISKQGFMFGQALNTPRMYFSKRGYAPWRAKDNADRLADLQKATRGTVPNRMYWKKEFSAAVKRGDLQFIEGDAVAINKAADGTLQTTIQGATPQVIASDKVIAATGFLPAIHHPLVRDLVASFDLPIVDTFIAIDSDFCVPKVSTPESCLFLVGPAAAWSLPSADSIAGMKIAARTIANTLLGKETWRFHELGSKTLRWFTLVTGGELV